ncbi:MAG: helix-turn-helix domain-containing protein, partial [Sphaerochaeta sp.]|nr:helix-turn-helix domain-containing protein [Sphaerochaeta sp.]
PVLRQAQEPEGTASAPSTSSGTTGSATGATVANMGGVLRAWMNMEGMSQAHLSVKSGVNAASVSRHIRNLDPIGPRALEKYARVFGVSVKEFLAKPAEEKPEPDPGAVTVLKKWLLMSGKIQADIRRALGVSSGELSNQVAGKNKLTPRRQAEYAKFFGVSVEEFLRGPSALPPSTGSGTTGAATGGAKGKKHQTDQTENTGKATRQEKKEPEDLEPLAAAYCEMCRAMGDGYCEGCAVREMLKAAARQETPGEITQNAKQAVCSRCKTRKKGECGACRLKSLWAAKEAFGGGESIADAVANAEAEYQAAVALEKE